MTSIVFDSTRNFTPITPSNSVNFPQGETNFIYVGGAGNITAICNGVPVLFTALPIGFHPIRCTRINVTGTTATAMLGAR